MKNKTELKPFFSTHPGELLLDEMKERKISQIKIATQTGVKPSFLNEIIKFDLKIELKLKFIDTLNPFL